MEPAYQRGEAGLVTHLHTVRMTIYEHTYDVYVVGIW